MNDTTETAEIHEGALRELENYTPEEQARIVRDGIKIAKARKRGNESSRKQKEARHAFIIETGRGLRKKYPHYHNGSIIGEIELAMQDHGRRFTFGSTGRLPKTRTIYEICRSAGGIFKDE